ncbi:hypothetical protein SUGI_0279800 [Cryptomeria japonica]|uniref:voltage-dependent chloride channel 1, chloroplastic n=1 Tax=Cryptomeria japonica TaxID=3369 RepID=UPI002408A188|nr:voltage-dependent chloride channel 1, chloroplastic [Cryptomeria japonica]GLJ16443.1 hypothetical protein SUGI_0279800 [Cryptomeria japonica]
MSGINRKEMGKNVVQISLCVGGRGRVRVRVIMRMMGLGCAQNSHFYLHLSSPPGVQISRRQRVICDQRATNYMEKLKGSVWRMVNVIPEWADEIKERGMQQRRALYSHDDWLKHRSSKRHIRHWLSSLSSRVILSLVPPMCVVTVYAAAVASYNTGVSSHVLPGFMPLLHAPTLPSELVAPALALLLVFRTEASYSRYDEGRKTWTNVISTTKDFARHASAWIRIENGGGTHSTLSSDLLAYIMAFPVALKCHIIHGSDVEQDLGRLLSKEDLALVLSSHHRPNCIIQFLSESLMYLPLDDSKKQVLDSHISEFNEAVSVCERLIRSPIPLSYTRLTSRLLVFWHLTLPIILWDECQWMVVPATLFSASSLFCIEEVGVLIEEPFPILALDKMCAIVHENIMEMLKFHNRVEDHLRHKMDRLPLISSDFNNLISPPSCLCMESHKQPF